MVERHQAPIHPGADAAVSHLGVHPVGEVDRRRAGGQGDQAPFRREDVHLVLAKVGLQVQHEVVGVGQVLLPVDDAVQPVAVVLGVRVDRRRRRRRFQHRALLVGPVGRHPKLGLAVHFTGADLHLDRLAAGPDDRRVQRLVQVELGHGDVVPEPTGDRPPQGVDGAECGVGVRLVGDDDPHAHQVVDLVEAPTSDHHLFVQAPQVLRSPGDVGVHPDALQTKAHLVDHLHQVQVSFRGALGDEVVDLGEHLRVQGGKAQVLELLAQLGHAQPVGQRGIHVERFAGLLLLVGRRHGGHRAQVVQPVGQLDDDHPQIVGHREDDLAHRLGLLVRLGVHLDAVELGAAVDEHADRRSELGADLGQRDVAILDRVVQQRRTHGGIVGPVTGDDGGDGQRVGDVGLAGCPQLPLVSGLGEVVGPLDQVDVGPVPGLVHRQDERAKLRRPRCAVSSPRQYACHRRHRGTSSVPSLRRTRRADAQRLDFLRGRGGWGRSYRSARSAARLSAATAPS